MAKLPKKTSLADLIFARRERDAEDWRRAHLGASILGKECARELWFNFRWAQNPTHPGRLLRLFERGHKEEASIIHELKELKLEVWDVVPETGKQYRVAWLGGHIGGGCDGILRGLAGAKKTPHLVEIKTSNDKRFNELQAKGVQVANPQHYTQMQTYMKGLKLTRALYICVNKNDDQIYVERVRFNEKHASAALVRAANVVTSPTPMPRLSEDPAFWKCKFCDFSPVCHEADYDKLKTNCRTCNESTPKSDGTWWCDHHGIALDDETQRKGCDVHLFLPQMLDAWEVAGANPDARKVHYKTPGGRVFTNAGGALTEVKS